ncbi:LCP family protein [Antribacter gilvus]|uniref:LCP family protein n=1 Tax=Antribacter gilvus TaxID=2304675 RepID=UPI001F0B76C6|nr:LCP family protein [Antribacter gilvus]
MVAAALLGALVLGGSTVAALVHRLTTDVEVSDVEGIVVGASTAPEPEDPDDPFSGVPVNILVMGTDVRDAANAALAGEEDGMRSDTTILVHVSADRTWVQVVSLPRDSMVEIPACHLPDGRMSEDYALGQLNGSFQAAGSLSGKDPEDLTYGAACTISTVMLNTGLPQPNHMIVKMDGVIDVVNAIGGVEVCLPEPIVEDPDYGGLNLPAGQQRLTGQQAIGYLRVRHGDGIQENRGDLGRIERQQGFVSNLIGQTLSAGTLTNVPVMLGLTQAVVSSISPDPALADPGTLTGLAFSLRDLERSRIVFTTVPNEPWSQNRNRVVWTDAADELWARLAADQPPPGLPPLPGQDGPTASPGSVPDGDPAPDPSAPATTGPVTPSSEVTAPPSGAETEPLPVPSGTC